MRKLSFAVCIAAAACSSARTGKLEPATPVTVDGVVADVSGQPMAGVAVALERTPDALSARTSLPCWPESDFVPFAQTTSDAQGRFSFSLEAGDAWFASGAARCLRVSHVEGARAARAAFDLRAAQTHLPQLSLQGVSLHPAGALSFNWTSPAAPLDSESLLLFTSDGWPVWRADELHGSAQLAPEVAEDAAALARWQGVQTATVSGGVLTVVFTEDLGTSGTSVRPLSRGASHCETSAGALSMPCPLTDGLFRDPLADAGVDWIAVHLGSAATVQRVVLHNVSADAGSVRLEGSMDGQSWAPLSDVQLAGFYPYFIDAHFAPAQVAHVRVTARQPPQGATAARLRGVGQISLY